MKDDLKLSDIPKHNIYEVPEHYFERLPMRVMERTTAMGPARFWQNAALWQTARIAMAPLLLLVVFLGVFYLNKPAQTNLSGNDLAALNDREIMDYLSTYVTLDSHDFTGIEGIEAQNMTADVLNVSAATAEEELEYYNIKQIDY